MRIDHDAIRLATLRSRVGHRMTDVLINGGASVDRGGKEVTARKRRFVRPQVVRGRGIRWELDLPGGVTREKLADFAPQIASSAAGLKGVHVETVEVALAPPPGERPWNANQGAITFWASDPLHHVVFGPPSQHLPRSLADGAVLGMRRDGSLVRAQIIGGHWLTGGISRFGKTSLQRCRMMNLRWLAMNGLPVAHIHAEFGKGLELKYTEPVCAVNSKDPTYVGMILRRLVTEEMPRRIERLDELGKSQFDVEDLDEEFPLIDVVLDELDVYTSLLDGEKRGCKEQADRIQHLKHLSKRSLALGISMDLISQQPLVDVIDTEVRFNLGFRVSCKTESPVDAEVTLGSYPKGIGPHRLPLNDASKGVMWSKAEGGELETWKAFYVDDDRYRRAMEWSAEHGTVHRLEHLTAPRRRKVETVGDIVDNLVDDIHKASDSPDERKKSA